MLEMLAVPFVGLDEYNKLTCGFEESRSAAELVKLAPPTELAELTDMYPFCIFRTHRHFDLNYGQIPVWTGASTFSLAPSSQERCENRGGRFLYPVSWVPISGRWHTMEYFLAESSPPALQFLSEEATEHILDKVMKCALTASSYRESSFGVTILPHFFSANDSYPGQRKYVEHEVVEGGKVVSTSVKSHTDWPEDFRGVPTIWKPSADEWILVSGCGCRMN